MNIQGYARKILDSSIGSALLAVEVYNKPRTSYRVETYITNMIMAWTKLFHSYFYKKGVSYYYRELNGVTYKRIDGEKKAWELSECIKKYGKLSDSVKENLKFFIKLRNRVEHSYVNKHEIDVSIFGECQSLLYNYETLLIELFGEKYALSENLVYSLQFSMLRNSNQRLANKSLISKEIAELKKFIDDYRTNLTDEVYSSQEFSIKLLQIPKISNTNRSDLAIEFVRWDVLSEEDIEAYNKVTTIIKDKLQHVEVANHGKLKPGDVLKKVNKGISAEVITHHDLRCLYYILSVRPTSIDKNLRPNQTNTDYCHYDEAHRDYLYKEKWVEFLIKNINAKVLKKSAWRENFKNQVKQDIGSLKSKKIFKRKKNKVKITVKK